MDTLLAAIAVLVLGALIISACVFAASARRYVTGETHRAQAEALESDLSPYRRTWVERAPRERRAQNDPVAFPIDLDGMRIDRDRRMNPDRRRAA